MHCIGFTDGWSVVLRWMLRFAYGFFAIQHEVGSIGVTLRLIHMSKTSNSESLFLDVILKNMTLRHDLVSDLWT